MTLKPSILLAVCSTLVIAFSLFMAAMALGNIASAWDGLSVIGGIMLLLPSLALAVQQYRGVFHRSAPASFTSAVLLFIIGAFGLIAFVEVCAGVVIEREPVSSWLSLLIILFSIGVTAGFAGWLDLQWSRQLRKSAPVAHSSPGRFRLRDLLAALTAVAYVLAIAVYVVHSTPPRCAENVSRAQAPFALPPDARDVSFCHGSRDTIAYEFTTTEPAFVDRCSPSVTGEFDARLPV